MQANIEQKSVNVRSNTDKRQLNIVTIVLAVAAAFVVSMLAYMFLFSGTSEAKSYIANLSRDPSSAQFRNVQVLGNCVTGQINGKNALGAYGGFSDFYYISTEKVGAVDPDNGFTPPLGDLIPGHQKASEEYNSIRDRCLAK